MKRLAAPLLLIVFAWARGFEANTPPNTIRVLTYNIHHGEGVDGVLDLTRLASIVQSANPDLVALQEVDQVTKRTHGVNQVAELQRLTGLHAEFGAAMSLEGGAYGVGVLSRWPILAAQNQPLPGSIDREPRTALTVMVRIGESGPLLQFTSTHLDQGREEEVRLSQVRRLNDLLVRQGAAAVLAGDMNARTDTDAMKTLEAKWANATTVLPLAPPASGRPRPRGDYVLFHPADAWRVLETDVIDETTASDHRPVLAVLELVR